MSSLVIDTSPIVTLDESMPGGHRPEVVIFGSAASVAVTIADGGDAAEGATTDAAATVGGAGTVSAKLRRVTRQLVVLGALASISETDPAAVSASIASLLRGILKTEVAMLAILTDIHNAALHSVRTTVAV